MGCYSASASSIASTKVNPLPTRSLSSPRMYPFPLPTNRIKNGIRQLGLYSMRNVCDWIRSNQRLSRCDSGFAFFAILISPCVALAGHPASSFACGSEQNTYRPLGEVLTFGSVADRFPVFVIHPAQPALRCLSGCWSPRPLVFFLCHLSIRDTLTTKHDRSTHSGFCIEFTHRQSPVHAADSSRAVFVRQGTRCPNARR
jgi:hypothetical protein